MFHTKKIQNKTVYFSDKLDVEHFFTSRELIIKENKDGEIGVDYGYVYIDMNNKLSIIWH